MLRAAVVAALISVAPSVTAAGPLTVGVDLGIAQSKSDTDGEGERTLGLYGRLRVSSHLALQLAIADVATGDQDTDLQTGTASLVVDLGSSGRIVPVLTAGIGLDSATSTWGGETKAHHIEGGIGLEYRAAGGLTIGFAVGIGDRTIDHDAVVAPQYDRGGVGISYCEYNQDCAYPESTVAPTLHDGEYRSAKITLGVRF